MAAPKKFPGELRERAVRLAVDARRDPATRSGALRRIGEQLGWPTGHGRLKRVPIWQGGHASGPDPSMVRTALSESGEAARRMTPATTGSASLAPPRRSSDPGSTGSRRRARRAPAAPREARRVSAARPAVGATPLTTSGTWSCTTRQSPALSARRLAWEVDPESPLDEPSRLRVGPHHHSGQQRHDILVVSCHPLRTKPISRDRSHRRRVRRLTGPSAWSM